MMPDKVNNQARNLLKLDVRDTSQININLVSSKTLTNSEIESETKKRWRKLSKKGSFDGEMFRLESYTY